MGVIPSIIFFEGSITSCLKEADIDQSCAVDIADLQRLIDNIFFGVMLPECP